MKLSLSWIFDHIDAPCHWDDVDNIVTLFNAKVAEIESFYRVSFDLSHFFLASVTEVGKTITLSIPEIKQNTSIKARNEIKAPVPGEFFIIKKEGETYRWATMQDLGNEKEGLLPAFDVASQDAETGNWRTLIENNDIIIEVDNKSITHRPDMWGHRGFAREIAAFLKVPLKNKDLFLKKQTVAEFDQKTKPTLTNPFTIENQVSLACPRFTGIYFSTIDNRASQLFIASRLLKIDAKPISMLVDLSNYLMFDWSQPVHMYDGGLLTDKQIVVRMAKPGEQLTLLDGAKLELTEHDVVIADGKKPLGLAGVKGGLDDSVNQNTKSIFFEAATFDAGTIRRAAQRHKVRTDASARFEKTLDTNMPVETIERFCKLLETYNVHATPSSEIIALGKGAVPEVIEVTHTFLEQRIGSTLTEHDVVDALTRLEFGVLKSINRNHEVTYLITVPTFRCLKDIKIKEDILEEVLRCWGFEKIKPVLAQFTRLPYRLSPVFRLRRIKRYLSYGLTMIEQQNYSMNDEQFLQQTGIKQQSSIAIVNPVSENYSHMISSLVPGLLKNIKENHVNRNALSFFECGRIWLTNNDAVIEQKSLAGIFFEKHTKIDFYEIKKKLTTILDIIDLDANKLRWVKINQEISPWYNKYQTAALWYDQTLIGLAGIADGLFLKKLDIDAPCDAFIFECNLDWLLTTPAALRRHAPLSKFQESYIDISMLAPCTLTAQAIIETLETVHVLVKKVSTIDFFEKEEWTDVRSLTFRLVIASEERNLEKQDIDAVLQASLDAAKELGATVRM